MQEMDQESSLYNIENYNGYHVKTKLLAKKTHAESLGPSEISCSNEVYVITGAVYRG